MKKIVYLLGLALLCIACETKSPEKDYQTCTAAEKAYNALVDKYKQESDAGTLTEERKASLDEESDTLFENAKAAFTDFYKKNINTAFAQKIFSESRWTRRLSPDQLDSVVQAVTDAAFKETDAYKSAADRLFRMKSTRAGNPYTNIVSKDPNGNTAELASYVGNGKYVLLDFWASWCPDCRKEMPELVELYAAYKDKNFEIVGYSLDKDKDAWIKGIEDLNITWPQLSDCDFWDSQGAKLYAVQSIPLSVLINPEGNIIERGSDIEMLKEKLVELIK
ncbi:MAG: TlpA family protein disulfide reductase [Candidatus Azobacteroides sp.]|nr:TlpA family protein disulfide reductase [Candidatus Azobacteroides sp.]